MDKQHKTQGGLGAGRKKVRTKGRRGRKGELNSARCSILEKRLAGEQQASPRTRTHCFIKTKQLSVPPKIKFKPCRSTLQVDTLPCAGWSIAQAQVCSKHEQTKKRTQDQASTLQCPVICCAVLCAAVRCSKLAR